jgi:hypothetical protein
MVQRLNKDKDYSKKNRLLSKRIRVLEDDEYRKGWLCKGYNKLHKQKKLSEYDEDQLINAIDHYLFG